MHACNVHLCMAWHPHILTPLLRRRIGDRLSQLLPFHLLIAILGQFMPFRLLIALRRRAGRSTFSIGQHVLQPAEFVVYL